MFLHRA